MPELNADQKYLVEEFYEDYRAGRLSRRSFMRRIVFIMGSVAAAIAVMSAMGCTAEELPAPDEPMPTPEPGETPVVSPPTSEATAGADAALVPVPGATSPFSVPEGHPAVETSRVTFTSQGDEIAAYLARPAGDGVHAAVLVCHENRGLNAHIEDVARRFAVAGYVALAIDLLSREGGTASHGSDEVPGLLGQAGPERHVADFIAGYQYLQGLDDVDGERIGMNGYCFGGGVTWETATRLPDLKAAVPFYGRAPDLARVADIRAAVLGVYGELDTRINAGIEPLEQALIASGVTHQINVYPGANHAFHNDTGGRYVEEQATQAWVDMLAWFARYL
ncbi:MAG: dienelactone hydrolase family protein [Anaerolineae bacterium]|nr:dienelactone hydrolase family protein [Anaerolineae bacterium]